MPCAIVDRRISEKCLASLTALGFKVIKLEPHNALGKAVASHPDMLIHKIGKKLFVTKGYYSKNEAIFTDIKNSYPYIEVITTNDEYEPNYPEDVKFNLLKMGKLAFGRLDAISRELKENLVNDGYEFINTKQGYPACTTLPLGADRVITADCGMAKVFSQYGISVLKIKEGDIALPPHEYGFIGGCSGVYDRCVYFIGNIDTHTDALKIKSFIKDAGYTHISLSDEKLVDLGGIIFID